MIVAPCSCNPRGDEPRTHLSSGHSSNPVEPMPGMKREQKPRLRGGGDGVAALAVDSGDHPLIAPFRSGCQGRSR